MKNFYGFEILEQEVLEGGMIKIIVSMYGSSVEYHVTQEELDNAS